MSKIICDVCGTSYPDTAQQCPICGCVRPGDSGSHYHEHEDGEHQDGGYTYIKGGRFSKANVKKRNKGRQHVEHRDESLYESSDGEEKPKGAIGLIIAVLLILLTVIAVVVYISISFFWPSDSKDDAKNQIPETSASEQQPSETDSFLIPCTGLTSDRKEIPLGNDDGWLLSVTKEPADTTDVLSFSSNDTSVVTVNDKGMITPVGPGKTEVIATCGDQTYTWIVVCEKETIEETTAETTEETTVETTEETAVETTEEDSFHLNRKDITFSYKGESWDLHEGSVPASMITWTSDDESVAKIENGIATAVGNGVTNVYGTYNGEKVSCIIRCSLGEEEEDLGGAGVGEDSGGASADVGSSSSTYYLDNLYSDYDTNPTVQAGGTFPLKLKDENGNSVDATWTSNKPDVCTVDSTGFVTAVSAGVAEICATFDGQTYICTVTVY